MEEHIEGELPDMIIDLVRILAGYCPTFKHEAIFCFKKSKIKKLFRDFQFLEHTKKIDSKKLKSVNIVLIYEVASCWIVGHS